VEMGRILKEADDWLALPKRDPTELVNRVATLLKRAPLVISPSLSRRNEMLDAPNKSGQGTQGK
jgi:hypothetical protein